MGPEGPGESYLMPAGDLTDVDGGALLLGPSGRQCVVHSTGTAHGSASGLIAVDTDLGRLFFGPTEKVTYRP
jgi:hypothetical protein